MAPELLILALDYYRAPLRYPQLASPDRPLPESFDNLIGAFAGALSPRNIETTAKALKTSPAAIKKASTFFLRQVLMAPGADHYRVLGLSRDASEETIRKHYHLLVRIFHPDRSGGESERDAGYTARINNAYSTLRKRDRRQRYDRQLAAAPRGGQSTPADNSRFSPAKPVAPSRPYERTATRFGSREQRLKLLLAGGVLAMAAIMALVFWSSSMRPTLRVNPGLANESVAEPSFLRQRTTSEPVSRFVPGSETSPETIAAPARDGTRGQTSAASKEAAFTAEYEPGAPSNRKKTGDEIRGEILTDLDPRPVAPKKTKESAPESRPADTRAVEIVATAPAAKGVTKAAAPAKTKESASESGAADARAVEIVSTVPEAKRVAEAAAPEKTKESAPESGAADTRAVEIVATAPEVKRVTKATAPAKRRIKPKGVPAKDGKARPTKTTSYPRQATTPRDEPAVAKEQKKKAIRDEPPQKPRARKQRGPEQVIARLTRYYRAGDVQGLVGLFTANAHITGGTGTSFIRADYSKFFAGTSDRRLSVRSLSWRGAGNGKIVGNGRYRAGTKDSPDASWRYSTGTLRIELVPWMDGYKISKLVHR